MQRRRATPLLCLLALGAAAPPDFDGRSVSTHTAVLQEAEFLPMKVPELRRPEPPRADPRAGRDFRQITETSNDLLLGQPPDPQLLDPSQPRPQGGYYYGYLRGPGGKLRYVKLYIPFYGPYPGGFHNEPPPLRLNRPRRKVIK